MIINRRTFGMGLAAGGAALTVPGLARAAGWPSRPITYVIPFNPGGESDVTARFQQPFMEAMTGQSVVITSKPGAGGATAWAQLNGMDADGHTIMNVNLPHIVLQPSMKDVGYQTDDIDVIFIFHYTPDAILVRADSPYQTLQDLIDDASANPGRVTFGGSGTNTANHLASVIFQGMTGTNVTYVPFKGSAPSMTALLGGQIAVGMSYTTQNVKAGDQVRALAVATEERVASAQDTPTFKELGFDYVGGAYRGVAMPKGAPQEVRQALSDLLAQINAEPEFRRQMSEGGYEVIDIPLADIPAFMDDRKAAYASAIERLQNS